MIIQFKKTLVLMWAAISLANGAATETDNLNEEVSSFFGALVGYEAVDQPAFRTAIRSQSFAKIVIFADQNNHFPLANKRSFLIEDGAIASAYKLTGKSAPLSPDQELPSYEIEYNQAIKSPWFLFAVSVAFFEGIGVEANKTFATYFIRSALSTFNDMKSTLSPDARWHFLRIQYHQHSRNEGRTLGACVLEYIELAKAGCYKSCQRVYEISKGVGVDLATVNYQISNYGTVSRLVEDYKTYYLPKIRNETIRQKCFNAISGLAVS